MSTHYSKEKLTRIMSKIVSRIEKRKNNFVKRNPLMANASIDFVFSTNYELSVLYYCKQLLMANHPDLTPAEAKEKNIFIAKYAKQKGISRSVARSQLSNLNSFSNPIEEMHIDSGIVKLFKK